VADEQLQWFQGRLVALANAYDVLTRENWEGATIRELLATVLAPLSGPHSARFAATGPDLRLVLSLSMALHELCTNAAKYGALSNDTGQVQVDWSLSGTNGSARLRLRWQEVGGPPVAPPQRKGFGSRLITRGVAHELSAEVRLQFLATGVVCDIDAPLA
jgi:two-component sensor histidine kinase